ncbi:hypothetical protein BpHYR1_026009 [Brachionus plicatilis]|uniref:Uncharacterized protein n=1 Tax=Brachionus plicatilis TaxID=10195 RepID=A0A3M7QA85_BRAPC|nr:hypothetical protein BpHYR1_026009 [Brachionus plicatilis]
MSFSDVLDLIGLDSVFLYQPSTTYSLIMVLPDYLKEKFSRAKRLPLPITIDRILLFPIFTSQAFYLLQLIIFKEIYKLNVPDKK